MRAYVAIFGARFRALLQYRAAAIAGLVTQVFWGFIRVMIFAAFYASSDAAQPMSLTDVVTYVWLTQALLLLLPWRPDPEVETLVRSGNVAYELLRPVDLYALWLARAFAQRTAPVLLRGIPLCILAALAFDLGAPASLAGGAAFVLSLGCAVALSATMTTLLSISLLITLSGRGIHVLTLSLVNLLSGGLIPLPLLPGWLESIAELLPFRGLLDTPLRLYLGHLPPSAVFEVIGHQVLWVVVLGLAGRWWLRRVTRRIVVQGG